MRWFTDLRHPALRPVRSSRSGNDNFFLKRGVDVHGNTPLLWVAGATPMLARTNVKWHATSWLAKALESEPPSVSRPAGTDERRYRGSGAGDVSAPPTRA